MARILNNRYPIDVVGRKAVGFDFPLNGSAVFTPTYTTRDQIKANLINWLLTNKGERVFNPTFGADLRNLLFEGIEDTTTEELRYRIQNDIGLYFPQISVQEVKFDNIPDMNEIKFTLIYSIKSFGIIDDITIVLQ